jgi:tetratricopeptide (TPR) repeat protein
MVNSYMMFLLVLGFIGSIALTKEVSNESAAPPLKETPRSLNPWIAIVILIFFSFSFFKFVIQPIRTDAYIINALRAPPASEQRLSLYKKTLETSPVGKYQIREIFADSAINFSQSETAKQVPVENLKSELDYLSEELKKSIKESPLDFRAHLKLGHLYNAYTYINLPKFSEAEEILKRTVELSPTNQQGYWALAQTKLWQGKFEEALSLSEKAVDLEPRVKKSHLIVIQVAKLIGKYDLVKQKAEEAIAIDPSWEPEIKEILEKQ